jgi:Protein of unknown function (DUF1552)
MFLRQRRLSRRAVLRNLGAAVALPWLDVMSPAGAAGARRANRVRLVCVEMVHGSAGSSALGIQQHLWAPAATGRDFDLRPTSLASLEPFRERLTIVSNTDCANAEPFTASEIGGDHFRSSAVFLTQAHPKQTAGANVEAGTSLDQLYAQRVGADTPIPSLQLCIENVDQAGGCGYGYSCVYTDTISWSAPTRPLPMLRDPRMVFDRLFQVTRPDLDPDDRRRRLADERSILDSLVRSIARLRSGLGAADRLRLGEHLDSVREVEQRIQRVERYNASGEPRELPAAPIGVPDSFSEHVGIMFELQALAFASDITRVVSFKLGRDNSNRTYPESGFNGAFHPASHHGGKEDRIRQFAVLNAYHVSMIPRFLDRLKRTVDAEGNLLDNTLLMYGSSMGDSNQHNHKRVPFFLCGRGGGAVRGGVHLRAANGTPLADVMLAVLHALGVDATSFGDSEGVFSLDA